MKRKLLAALMMLIAAPALAIDIDITNHPDKDFMLGYKNNYPGDCDVMWWGSKWNTEHIITLGECKGLTEEKVMSDLYKLRDQVKATTNHANFSEYFREQERNTGFDLSRGFCIFKSTTDYVFTTLESPQHPGWLIINTSQNPIYGLWKLDPDGSVITKTHLNSLHPETRKLDLSQIQDCQTLKRYEPARP